MSESTELVAYDAMCSAIAECIRVDEVKEIHDKALALEMYSRLARNVDNERNAALIRLRAERKAGQLLRATEKAKGGGRQPHRSRDGMGETPAAETPATLADLGISNNQSARWQKLGAVPEKKFEAALAQPGVPTTHGILAQTEPPPPRDPMLDEALWFWGRLRDLERRGVLDHDPAALRSALMDDSMRTELDGLAPRIAAWLGRWQ